MTDPSAFDVPADIARTAALQGGAPSAGKLLVVVDSSAEMRVAVLYACHRAVATGARVCLMAVVPPLEFRGLAGVEERMKDEAFDAARAHLYDIAGNVVSITGRLAELIVRGGIVQDELRKLMAEEPEIRMLVLAAAAGPDGPGPLVTRFATGGVPFPRPVTLVPGTLTDEEIAQLA